MRAPREPAGGRAGVAVAVSIFAGYPQRAVYTVPLLAAWSRPGTKYFAGVAAVSAALVYGAPLVGPTIAGLPPLSTMLIVRTADLLVFALPVLSGMTPRRVEQFADPQGSLDTAASGAFHVTAPVTSSVFDLLGIRYLMLAPGATSPAPHLVRDYDGPDAVVYRNDRALPRAFLVSRARTCSRTSRPCAFSTRAGWTRDRRC